MFPPRGWGCGALNVAGMLYPVHPPQVTAMGMLAADSLQLEDVAGGVRAEGRFEFLMVGMPLQLPGARVTVESDRDLLGSGEGGSTAEVQGKVALVTGATTGGQATAVRPATEGAVVAVN